MGPDSAKVANLLPTSGARRARDTAYDVTVKPPPSPIIDNEVDTEPKVVTEILCLGD